MTREIQNTNNASENFTPGGAAPGADFSTERVLVDKDSTRIVNAMTQSSSDAQLPLVAIEPNIMLEPKPWHINPFWCGTPWGPSYEVLEEELGEIPLTKDQRDMGEALLKALKGNPYMNISDLAKVVQDNSWDPDNFRKAADAVNEVLKKHNMIGTLHIGCDGTLRLNSLTIHPDGSYEIADTSREPLDKGVPFNPFKGLITPY